MKMAEVLIPPELTAEVPIPPELTAEVPIPPELIPTHLSFHSEETFSHIQRYRMSPSDSVNRAFLGEGNTSDWKRKMTMDSVDRRTNQLQSATKTKVSL
jgi:hypothetical protein